MLFVVACIAGCGGGGGSDQMLPTVSPVDLWADIFSARRPVIIDVRTAYEFDLAHLPHSGSDPNCGCNTVNAAQSAGRNVVVVGGTEDHGQRAAGEVTQPGDQVRVLAGGFLGWPHGLDISATQLHEWLLGNRPLLLVDVRTPAEWQDHRLPGTVNLPLGDIGAWSQRLSPRDEIVCVCAAGGRSAVARDQLAQQGFTRVHNLLGGTDGWPYPLEGPGGAAPQAMAPHGSVAGRCTAPPVTAWHPAPAPTGFRNSP